MLFRAVIVPIWRLPPSAHAGAGTFSLMRAASARVFAATFLRWVEAVASASVAQGLLSPRLVLAIFAIVMTSEISIAAPRSVSASRTSASVSPASAREILPHQVRDRESAPPMELGVVGRSHPEPNDSSRVGIGLHYRDGNRSGRQSMSIVRVSSIYCYGVRSIRCERISRRSLNCAVMFCIQTTCGNGSGAFGPS